MHMTAFYRPRRKRLPVVFQRSDADWSDLTVLLNTAWRTSTLEFSWQYKNTFINVCQYKKEGPALPPGLNHAQKNRLRITRRVLLERPAAKKSVKRQLFK